MANEQRSSRKGDAENTDKGSQGMQSLGKGVGGTQFSLKKATFASDSERR